MNEEEIELARKKGKLCWRPKIYTVDEEKRFRTQDGVEYRIKKGSDKHAARGTAQAIIPRNRMSKKARRKMRREMGV
jgi:hypothetical protein